MSKTNSSVPSATLPLRAPSLPGRKSIPVLPSGELDCDPDPDPGRVLAELQDAVSYDTSLKILTPVGMSNADAARLNRATVAEQEQAKKLAAIQSQATPKWKPARPGRTIRQVRSGKNPRGRQKSAHVHEVEKALLVSGHLPPKALPLENWLTVLHNKGIMFPVPDSEPPHSISYRDAWQVPKYQNTIRKRLKKILGSKLLSA
jgi:hypothetical protein